MLRIKDPQITVPFYQEKFGMKLIHRFIRISFLLITFFFFFFFLYDLMISLCSLLILFRYDFPQWNFSLYFLGIFPEGTILPEPGTNEAEHFLWTMDGVCLELTHNYGTENDENYKVNNGNVEPHR